MRRALSLFAPLHVSTTLCMMSRGAFIVFEGGDHSGKTTQCAQLVEVLQKEGHDVKGMRFPDRESPSGQMIREYLTQDREMDDRALHLLFSANRWERSQFMCDTLNAGTTLVCDRYAYSGVAFTAAKGYDLEWCRAPDAGLPSPDLVLFLDLPVGEAARRGTFGEERYEKTGFQEDVVAVFRRLRQPSWKVVDAARPTEAVHAECLAAAHTTLRTVLSGAPLTSLWG